MSSDEEFPQASEMKGRLIGLNPSTPNSNQPPQVWRMEFKRGINKYWIYSPNGQFFGEVKETGAARLLVQFGNAALAAAQVAQAADKQAHFANTQADRFLAVIRGALIEHIQVENTMNGNEANAGLGPLEKLPPIDWVAEAVAINEQYTVKKEA